MINKQKCSNAMEYRSIGFHYAPVWIRNLLLTELVNVPMELINVRTYLHIRATIKNAEQNARHSNHNKSLKQLIYR